MLNEIFKAEFQENLYKGSEFLTKSVSHSADIVGNVVHIPNAGAKPGVEKNRSSFPASATERTNSDLTYIVDSYTLDPIRVRNYEEIQTKPSLASSVMMNGIETIRENITDNTIFAWASNVTVGGSASALPASSIIETSGADSSDNLPNGTATGTRKKITALDFRKAMKILGKQEIPKTGRCCLISEDMYHELLEIEAITSADKLGTGETPLSTGSVGRLFGFEIFVRSTVLTYSNLGVLQAPGASEATGDKGGAIFWHPSTVCLADGATNIYSGKGEGNGDPLHYGVIVSGEKLMGASRLRADNKGVVVLVQGA